MTKTSPTLNKQYLHWLFRDKYRYSQAKIADYFNNPVIHKLPQAIKSDLARLESGEPINYIIGWVNFCSCYIDLSYKPLIPRSETEYLTKLIITGISSLIQPPPFRVLDLCCGSGCIGIALLKNVANVYVDFADISPNAIKQTQKNLKINKISSRRFSIISSDLFKQLTSKKYDFIISNPPYLTHSQANVKQLRFEPDIALKAGSGGLFFIKQILKQLNKHLLPNGHFFLEFDSPQKQKIKKLVNSSLYKINFINDQFGQVRFLHLTRIKNKTIFKLN